MHDTEEDDTFTRFDVNPYNVTLFEKVFFYTVSHLEWLAVFVHRYQDSHIILSNGESAQNEPVAQNLEIDFDAYYDEILATIFPRRLEFAGKQAVLRDRLT